MIHLCTCTGGSASTVVSASKSRGGTVSCKNCGGKPPIDGKRSSSSCLLSTVLELTSLINSDFTWTKVSKGCRSSSRRPRRSNTINSTGGELLTKGSKGLEMPVSESEKLGVSVLGCHFSEKTEHIPIKKRRFLFRASSSPCSAPNPSSDATTLKASVHGLQLNPNATCLSAASEPVTEICNDDKSDEKESVKAGEDEDFSGISILAAAACSNSLGVEAERCEGSGVISSEAPTTVEFNESNNSHRKSDSSPEESTLDNSSQIPIESQKSSARDVRLNWDLNTVMDAWEEPFGSEHEISASVEEKKIDNMKRSSGECASKDISNLILPDDPKSLAQESELKPGKCEPKSLHNKHIDKANDAIPVEKWVNPSGKNAGDLGCSKAVDTKLSMDCSVPPGFDHCLHMRVSKENVNFPISTTQTVTTINSEKHDLSLTTAAFLENGAHQSVVKSKDEDEARVEMVLISNGVAMEDLVSKETDLPQVDSKVENLATIGALPVGHSEIEDQPAALSSMHDDNSLSDNRAGSGIDKLEELSVGYDSQYEDGELRESSMHTNLDLGITDANGTSSQCEQVDSSRIKPTDIGPGKEADVLSSVLLPEKLHSSDEVSGSGPNEIIADQGSSKKPDVLKNAKLSDEWKMNVSGWDLLPENHRISSNSFSKTRNFSGRKFSYREQKDGFETEDAETKVEGSRFYRKESLTRVGAPSAPDMFISSRGRFRMQGCSSKAADDLPSRPERDLGPLRSFGRGRYSPPSRATGRGTGMWNRSPDRGRDLKRIPSPSYQGPSFRSMLEDIDNMTNESGMDPNDIRRPNRTFRSRSPMNREESDFRARLGLRPMGDTGHERFVNVGRARGRGRTMRYGPGSRFHGPASDECDELVTEYSYPFPRRRRCFSPIDRRGNQNQNHSYAHHRSDSRSPSRPRTRSPVGNAGFRRRSSRSPNFRPDARMRRPRSPNYRRFEADHEYNSGPRNNTSPSSRWVNYKERSAVFDRRSPPPPPGRTDLPPGERERERFGFYDSSRKPKQNEYFRSGLRFSYLNEGGRGRPRYTDGDRPNHGYRRGGFVRRYNMDEPTKRFHYDEEDGFGPGYDSRDKHALEFHARGNPKPFDNGTTDSRFRDFPRRPRDDRDTVAGDFRRRSREAKDDVSEHMTDGSQRRPKEAKDDSTNVNSKPNEEVKEGDKPILGST